MKWASREHRRGEIGYAFHPRCAGKGYATEAAAAMVRGRFRHLVVVEDGEIAGVLSVRDIVRAQRAAFDAQAEPVQGETAQLESV